MPEYSVERRQVDLPGTRFSQVFSSLPPATNPGSRLSIDTTQTQTQTSLSGLPTSTSTSSTMSQVSLPGTRLSTEPIATQTSAPSPTPSFSFKNVPNPDTCTAATIQWDYTGPAETVSFLITQSIEPHTEKATGLTKRDPIILQIASGIDAQLGTWTWPSVNVTGGVWYVLEAAGQGITVMSPQFFVANGSDTSCLITTPPPPGTSASPSGTSGTTSHTSSASVTSTPTSSPTILPVTGATSNSNARAGAIAGGVIGGVLIVGAAIAAYIYFGLCRRRPTRSRRRTMGGSAQLGKWGGLSSRDSGMDSPPGGAPMGSRPVISVALPSNQKRTTTEVASALSSPLSSSAHGHHGSVTTLTAPEEEKVLAYERGHEYVETVPSLDRVNRRRSSASTSGAFSPMSSISEPPTSAGSIGRSRARSPSQSQNHRALALARLDGESFVPVSTRTRSPSVPQRSAEAMAMPASPPYDAYAPSPINRTSSGGGPAGPRRAARKPVPALNASDLSHSSSPSPTPTPTPTPTAAVGASVSRGQSFASTVTLLSGSPPASAGLYKHETQSSATLRAAHATVGRQPSREDLEAAGLELPNLNHKSSFGDRQVHYLIPDMPPPPRD